MKIRFQLPLQPCNAGLFISSGKGIHPSRTISSCEIIFNVSGILEMFEGNKDFKVPPGETLLLEAGKRHGGTKSYSSESSFYWIHFMMNDGPIEKSIHKFMHLPKKCHLLHPEKMTELFREYLDAQESGTLTEIQASSLICLMLSEISESGKDSGQPNDRKSVELAVKVENLIKSNVGNPELSNSWLAGKLRCNPDYMGRVFKKVHGRTVTDEIHGRRIGAAKRLLLDSAMNIKEIASKCGFSDTIYFRRIFRKITGQKPLAYRRQFSKMHINTEL